MPNEPFPFSTSIKERSSIEVSWDQGNLLLCWTVLCSGLLGAVPELACPDSSTENQPSISNYSNRGLEIKGCLGMMWHSKHMEIRVYLCICL